MELLRFSLEFPYTNLYIQLFTINSKPSQMLFYSVFIILLLFPGLIDAQPGYLSLKDALLLAELHDTGLESARIDVETGDALVREATAGAMPVVSLSASTGRYVISPTTSIPAFGPGKFHLTPANDAAVGIQIAQPVWLGGRVGLALEAAKIYGNLSRASLLAAKANLKKRVIKDYFSLSLALEVLKVTEETFIQAKNHSEKAKQLFDVGMISEFDLLRAQTEVKSFEPELRRAIQILELARTNLINNLGLPQDSQIVLTDSLTTYTGDIPNGETGALFESAVGRRPEFKVVALQKSLNNISLKVEERSIYWPNIYFNLIYQTQGQDDHYANMSPSTWSTAMRWGLSVNIPLFDGFATPARVEKARLGIRRTALAEQELRNGVRMEVTAALTEFRRAYETAAGNEEVLKLAAKAYSISLVRYEQGLGTELDVQDARLTLNRSRLGYLQGLYDLRMAEAEFARVIENDSDLNSGN